MDQKEAGAAQAKVGAIIGFVSNSTPERLSQTIVKAENGNQPENEAERFVVVSTYILLRYFGKEDYTIFQQQINGHNGPALQLFLDYIAGDFSVLSENGHHANGRSA